MPYNLLKFTDICEELYNKVQNNQEYKDALFRVAAQLMHEMGMSYGSIEAMDAISTECQKLLKSNEVD